MSYNHGHAATDMGSQPSQTSQPTASPGKTEIPAYRRYWNLEWELLQQLSPEKARMIREEAEKAAQAAAASG